MNVPRSLTASRKRIRQARSEKLASRLISSPPLRDDELRRRQGRVPDRRQTLARFRDLIATSIDCRSSTTIVRPARCSRNSYVVLHDGVDINLTTGSHKFTRVGETLVATASGGHAVTLRRAPR